QSGATRAISSGVSATLVGLGAGGASSPQRAWRSERVHESSRTSQAGVQHSIPSRHTRDTGGSAPVSRAVHREAVLIACRQSPRSTHHGSDTGTSSSGSLGVHGRVGYQEEE